jgi:hypothetical protein
LFSFSLAGFAVISEPLAVSGWLSVAIPIAVGQMGIAYFCRSTYFKRATAN